MQHAACSRYSWCTGDSFFFYYAHARDKALKLSWTSPSFKPLGTWAEEETRPNQWRNHCDYVVIGGWYVQWLVSELQWLYAMCRTARAQHYPTRTHCWALTLLTCITLIRHQNYQPSYHCFSRCFGVIDNGQRGLNPTFLLNRYLVDPKPRSPVCNLSGTEWVLAACSTSVLSQFVCLEPVLLLNRSLLNRDPCCNLSGLEWAIFTYQVQLLECPCWAIFYLS